MCASYEEGGLNIRSLICLNEAINIKVCWDLLHSEEQWATIVRSRVLRKNHHIFSSIWSGIKPDFHVMKENSSWLIGNGKSISFWQDKWCGDPLVQTLNASPDVMNEFPHYLCDYIEDFH